MSHTIAWCHDECEQDDEGNCFEDMRCHPHGTVVCTDPECFHRNTCNGACETITDCGGNCDDNEQDPIYAHSDPGVPHDDYGHPLAKGECNVVLFTQWSEDLAEDYDGDEPLTYTDGPIEVTWEGEFYSWQYAS